MIEKKDLKEFGVIITMSLSLLFLSLLIVYYIVDNYVDVDSIFGGNIGGKKVYLLKSETKYMPYLKKTLGKEYSVLTIKPQVLNKIASKRNVLFVIDARKMDDNTIYAIQNYVKNGGSLIFNYATPKLIKAITDLRTTDILPADTFYTETSLLSPLQVNKSKVYLYDDLYLYDNESILDFTKDHESYGVMWSGNYGVGNWIYFSFPFYIFKNNNLIYTKNTLTNKKIHKNLFIEMVNYAYYGYKVVKYPFVDVDKMVLVDEYIDYKYHDNFINFIKKMGVKTTLFINPNIIKSKIDVNDKIEIASMSAKDKWKLEKYTTQNIIGYSNENDKKPNIDKLYNKYGFKYMLSDESNISGIYYDDFVVLKHDGFNDINLEDNVKNIKRDIDFFVKYKIYTITIHSYILGYKDNFSVLKDIINYAKKYPILTAKEIASRYKDSTKIEMKTMLTPSSLAVQITNNTLKEMHNFTFRVYSKFKFDKIESNFLNIRARIIKEAPNYVDVRVENMNKNIEFYLRFKK